MTEKIITIAIDGPVSAGKSSVSDAVAKALGIPHLDTGAFYRALAYGASESGIDLNDESALSAWLDDPGRARLSVRFDDNGQRTLLDGRDLTDLIRTPAMSQGASLVSRFKAVRARVVATSRFVAKSESILMDGRDIGTVVLPDAPVKIYLTASAEARAMRRFKEYQQKGLDTRFEEVLADLQKRDHQDQTRALDPLRQADDATLVDSSDLSFDQTVQAILERVRQVYGD